MTTSHPSRPRRMMLRVYKGADGKVLGASVGEEADAVRELEPDQRVEEHEIEVPDLDRFFAETSIETLDEAIRRYGRPAKSR